MKQLVNQASCGKVALKSEAVMVVVVTTFVTSDCIYRTSVATPLDDVGANLVGYCVTICVKDR